MFSIIDPPAGLLPRVRPVSAWLKSPFFMATVGMVTKVSVPL